MRPASVIGGSPPADQCPLTSVRHLSPIYGLSVSRPAAPPATGLLRMSAACARTVPHSPLLVACQSKFAPPPPPPARPPPTEQTLSNPLYTPHPVATSFHSARAGAYFTSTYQHPTVASSAPATSCSVIPHLRGNSILHRQQQQQHHHHNQHYHGTSCNRRRRRGRRRRRR